MTVADKTKLIVDRAHRDGSVIKVHAYEVVSRRGVAETDQYDVEIPANTAVKDRKAAIEAALKPLRDARMEQNPATADLSLEELGLDVTGAVAL
jgi:hypothetical protein